MPDRVADDPEGRRTDEPPRPVRVIKRYANRKLYDTGIGELTSMHRIEGLIRSGIDIRVVDHSSGRDVTPDVLAGILASSVGEHQREQEIAGLLALIRSPARAFAAMADDDTLAEELVAIRERIGALSATLDSLLESSQGKGTDTEGPEDKGKSGTGRRGKGTASAP